MLIVMAGVPGSGKSTLGVGVAGQLRCMAVSVDSLEAALRGGGISEDQPTGVAACVVAEVVVEQQLRFGHDVVVDAVNDAVEDVESACQRWRDLAGRCEQQVVFVEVFCSDPAVYRRRLEARERDRPGLPESSGGSVTERRENLDGWTGTHLRIDSMDDPRINVERVIAALFWSENTARQHNA